MADGVVLTGDWFKIDGDDYYDEALYYGTPIRARLKVEDLEAGTVEYYGIVEAD
jgi:hypothetical protein